MIPTFHAPEQNWTDWLTDTAVAIRSHVLAEGAVLVRGLALKKPVDISRARDALGIRTFQSIEKFGHRQEEVDGIVSPIRWPEERELCPYQEESFSLVVPNIVLTGCISPPGTGGEALISDVRQIFFHLPSDLAYRIKTHGWMMTRVFHPQFGMSWQDAFSSTERDELSSLLEQMDIDFEWLEDGTLRTQRRRPAFRIHPKTGDECWFNQLAFLNRGSLESRERELLSLAFGNDLPVDTALGNGQSLSESNLLALHSAYDATTKKLTWRAGDLLIVDNLLTAQGKSPMTGIPEFWVAFGDPIPEKPFEKVRLDNDDSRN